MVIAYFASKPLLRVVPSAIKETLSIKKFVAALESSLPLNLIFTVCPL
jgi:hypothetical protein